MARKIFLFLLTVFCGVSLSFAQDKTSNSASAAPNSPRIISLPKPKYPSEAKTAKAAGKVEISVTVDEKGNVISAAAISGHPLLRNAAVEAAKKAKFAPNALAGKPVQTFTVLTYNFDNFDLTDNYFVPTKLEDFADVKRESENYEAILNLVENYKVAFGYADGNFHSEMPLTRADFAQFLRLTLDFLDARAKLANKNAKEINLFVAFNPQKIASVEKIKDFRKNQPFSDSVKTLLEKYDIVLVDGLQQFRANQYLTQNELIDVWTQIFGAETVPINFRKTENFERTLSRGAFALFLYESLGVLTYKILP